MIRTAGERGTVIITRVSSDRQVRFGESIPEQERVCRDWYRRLRESNADVGPLVDVIIDPGVSGGDAQRPGLLKLEEWIRSGRVAYVLAFHSSRTARDMYVGSRLLRLGKEFGVRIRYGNLADVDDSRAAGKLMINASLMVDQFWLDQSIDYARDKKLSQRDTHQLTTAARTFGYTYFPQPIKEYRINEAEAAVLREMYRRVRVEGHTVTALRNWLEDSGVPTPRGGRWNKHTITNMLRNRAYMGIGVSYKYDREDRHLHRPMRIRPEEQWGWRPMPPIVSEAEWQEVQRILSHRAIDRAARSTPARHNLLSGRIWCGVCAELGRTPQRLRGHSGTTREGKTHYYYVCTTRVDPHARHEPCSLPYVPAEDLENEVMTQLRDLIADHRQVLTRHIRANDSAAARVDREIALADEQVVRLRRGRANLLDLVGQGDLPAAEGRERLRSQDAQIAQVEERVAVLKNELRTIAAAKDALLHLPAYETELATIDDAPPEDRIRLLRTLVERVEVRGGKGDDGNEDLDVTVWVTFDPEAAAAREPGLVRSQGMTDQSVVPSMAATRRPATR